MAVKEMLHGLRDGQFDIHLAAAAERHDKETQGVCDKNVGILFFRYLSLRLPSPHPPPASPLKGEKPYALALFWTKTLPVFPPLQGEGRVGVG
jgi:hypothetical protein